MSINRSKQQALAFLLGALLVGGVLGFSADRVLGRSPKPRGWRSQMYQDLALTQSQRASVDSVLDSQQCDMRKVMNTVRPQLDSLRDAGRRRIANLLTPQQRERFQERVRAEEARASGSRRKLHCE